MGSSLFFPPPFFLESGGNKEEEEEDGGRGAGLWSFVAVFQGLFGSSHPENLCSISVNCFSSASDPV